MFRMIFFSLLCFSSLFGEIITISVHFKDQVVVKEYERFSSVDFLKNDIYELFGLDFEHQRIEFDWQGYPCAVTKGEFSQNHIYCDTDVYVSYAEPLTPYEILMHIRFLDADFLDFDMMISSETSVDTFTQEIRKKTGYPRLDILVTDGRAVNAGRVWLESGYQMKDYLLAPIQYVSIWTKDSYD